LIFVNTLRQKETFSGVSRQTGSRMRRYPSWRLLTVKKEILKGYWWFFGEEI